MNPNCPACKSQENEVFSDKPTDFWYFHERKKTSKVLRCHSCESLYLEPWPTVKEVEGFYSKDYANYFRSKIPFLSQLYHIQQKIFCKIFQKRYPKHLKILDFGSGHGWFLRTLSHAGYENISGFDFVDWEDAKLNPKIYFCSNMEAFKNTSDKFDIIRLNHVIEHFSDPDEIMNLLSKKLEVGGAIIGQTPNSGHFTSVLFKKYWGLLHYPYHTLIFTEAGLKKAVPRWGLKLTKIEGTPLPSGWCLSFDDFVKDKFGIRKRGRTNFYTLYILISMPIAIIDYFISRKNTAVINFRLEKKDGPTSH